MDIVFIWEHILFKKYMCSQVEDYYLHKSDYGITFLVHEYLEGWLFGLAVNDS